MKLIDQSCELIQVPDSVVEKIEQAGRICYKSEHKITKDSAKRFVSALLAKGHESVIEHSTATVLFITNRGVTHELVRHRLASFSQESTRYVRHDDVVFIRPVWFNTASEFSQKIFIKSLKYLERDYCNLINLHKWRPEQAREVLPNALKTEIVVTANMREWRHIFKLRCSKKAHPQTRSLMIDALKKFKNQIPILFDDIEIK